MRNPAGLGLFAIEPTPQTLAASAEASVRLEFECRSRVDRAPKAAALVRLIAFAPADRGRDLTAARREAIGLIAGLAPQFASLIRRGVAAIAFEPPHPAEDGGPPIVRARMAASQTAGPVMLEGQACVELRAALDGTPGQLPKDRAEGLADLVESTAMLLHASIDEGFNSQAFAWSVTSDA